MIIEEAEQRKKADRERFEQRIKNETPGYNSQIKIIKM